MSQPTITAPDKPRRAKRRAEPGTFRATCNLSRPLVIADLPHYLRREYEDKGWVKSVRTIYDRKLRREVARECFLEPLCSGFETTDPAAFEEHMATLHGRKMSRNIWSSRPSEVPHRTEPLWRAPKLLEEGRPFVDREGLTETCPTCGLVSQHPHGLAAERWWAEHIELCVGVPS